MPYNTLFDLDGTLMDPREGFVVGIRHALLGLGCQPPSDSVIASHIGPPLEETLAGLLGPERRSRIGAAVALYRESYGSTGLFENAVYPGIPRALEEIRSAGARLFLATSKPRVFAVRILDHYGLSGFFTAVYGSGLDGTHSDKRQLVACLLDREGVPPGSACMIGDRSHDVRAAVANDVFPVGVLWGYGSRTELTDAGARLLCEIPEALPARLSEIAGGLESTKSTKSPNE